ncbi:MAG: hypothetical protein HY691_02875 [Chloroflexi bacterium]|nr:hypothetical protein [Chloroflexota bacterium]
MATSDQTLIKRYIELNPNRPGVDEARVVDYQVPVWALVAYWSAVNRDIARVAKDYGLPEDAVAAVLAFYRQHSAVIDARIATDAA